MVIEEIIKYLPELTKDKNLETKTSYNHDLRQFPNSKQNGKILSVLETEYLLWNKN